jgi:Mrp family chromosome partitioning ATPase
VLAVNDPIVLSTVADMVLLVIQAGETADHEVRLTRQRLDAAGSRIVGSVLTRFDDPRADRRYGYAYGAYSRAD